MPNWWWQYDQVAHTIIWKRKLWFWKLLQNRVGTDKILFIHGKIFEWSLPLPKKKKIICLLPTSNPSFQTRGEENPLNACETVLMCFLCTVINGGRMHCTQLFGFKASSVQRYFFLDNLISCCRFSESQTDFGGFNRKWISLKYHQISSQLPSWVHQKQRFSDQQQPIWWCSNWNCI